MTEVTMATAPTLTTNPDKPPQVVKLGENPCALMFCTGPGGMASVIAIALPHDGMSADEANEYIHANPVIDDRSIVLQIPNISIAIDLVTILSAALNLNHLRKADAMGEAQGNA